MPHASFMELVKSEKPTLVDFYAEWCGPCKMMKPILEELKNEVGDATRIIQIDVDKNPAVAELFKIRGVPTLAVFKEGELKWLQPGVMPAAQIRQVLERFS